jgi:hypothetical protein
MPNTEQERQKFKHCLAKVLEVYGRWVELSRHLRNLLAANEQQFDWMIRFKDPDEFNEVLTQRKFEAQAGCAVAALTVSRPRDNEPSEFKRIIYYNRGLDMEHTIVHELFHFLTHPRFTSELPTDAVEGVTEYFTLSILKPSSARLPAPAATAASAAAAAAPAVVEAPTLSSRTSDDSSGPASAYGAYTRKVNQTKQFLEDTAFSLIREDREFTLCTTRAENKGFLGRQRAQGFNPDPSGGIPLDKFMEYAYFKGEPHAINLIKDQWT